MKKQIWVSFHHVRALRHLQTSSPSPMEREWASIQSNLSVPNVSENNNSFWLFITLYVWTKNTARCHFHLEAWKQHESLKLKISLFPDALGTWWVAICEFGIPVSVHINIHCSSVWSLRRNLVTRTAAVWILISFPQLTAALTEGSQ